MSRRRVGRFDGRAPGAGLGSDDTGCTILHADMDAFYAAVELRSRPELVGRPVVVGGSTRSVVLSATYEARACGIHSAMPMSRARRLCPDAVVIPPNHERYAMVSRGVMAVFQAVTPCVEPLSLDEAFLDVSGSLRRLGPPTAIARAVRDRIADEQGITCSVGVAGTKFVAKLASSAAKPDGMLLVPTADTVRFLHALPVADLWGVGPRTGQTLARLGLHTVAELAHTPLRTLVRALGEAQGRQLHELAWGRDPRPVVSEAPHKSIGADETFARDVDDPAVVQREILRLAERVAARLRAAELVGRTVVLRVRFADFTTITRSRTLGSATDVGREVHAAAAELYDDLLLDRARVRLVGVRVSGLVAAASAPQQLELGAPDVGWRDAEQAVDRVSARFGPGAVRPATLVEPAGRPGPDPAGVPSRDRR